MSKTGTTGGAAWGAFLKLIFFGLMIYAGALAVGGLIDEVSLIWHKVKSGIFIGIKAFIVLLALIALCFAIALVCDALAPLASRIRKDRKARRAMARCGLPSLSAFRSGRSDMEGEQGKVDRL